jgi:hypothetical protein
MLRALAVWVVTGVVLAPIGATGMPFWGAKEPLPADTDPRSLKPGEFTWDPAAAPSGPMTVIVSLSEQRAYVYRNGVEIGVASASTGKPGHQTPTGVFTVLQKDRNHHSKTYDNAPMPYSERLTWGGVALHAGELPGYPSSHGCIHLPSEFALRLFQISSMGMVVVIADDHSAPGAVAHPGLLAPVSAATGADDAQPPLANGEADRWQPELSPSGPVSIVVSGSDRRMVVLRNGVEIGRARVTLTKPEEELGTNVFTVVDGGSAASPSWVAIGVPGHAGSDDTPDPTAASRVTIPPDFRADLRALLVPGTTLVVTDAAILPDTTGTRLEIANADPAPAG